MVHALFWLVLHLRAIFGISLKHTASLSNWERNSSQRAERILLFVPGFASLEDARQFRQHAVSKFVADIRIDCAVFSYDINKTRALSDMLGDTCDIYMNHGGAYLEHFAAANVLASRYLGRVPQNSHVMLWGPRVWVPPSDFDISLLVDIMKSNNLQAIAPSLDKLGCPPAARDTNVVPYGRKADATTEDLDIMFQKPLDGSNSSVGRRVNFIEWQSALFEGEAFGCIASFIRRLGLKYWGSDMVFPTVCKARVGVVDLPDLSVRKCRKGSTGDTYNRGIGWHDIAVALKEANIPRSPRQKTFGRLVWPK